MRISRGDPFDKWSGEERVVAVLGSKAWGSILCGFGSADFSRASSASIESRAN